MDRANTGATVKQDEYIQSNVTVGEFIDRIEPKVGSDGCRRLRLLLEDSLSVPMPR